MDHAGFVAHVRADADRIAALAPDGPDQPAARDALLHELTTRDPAQGCPTWWPDDQTVGFWARRMAHESAIHRLDVEIALGQVTPVDAALAVDGVDEVLRRFLAGDWSDEPVAAGAGSVLEVTTGDRRWRVVLEPKAVVVVTPRHDLPGDATISGDPVTLYRWAWGRGEADGIGVEGDTEVLALLRSRLAEATQ